MARTEYLFEEVFNNAGSAIYGKKWTGRELVSRALKPPTEIARERQWLENELSDARAKAQEEFDPKISSSPLISVQMQELLNRQFNLPELDESYIAEFEANQRAAFNEQFILEALAAGRLTANVSNGGTQVDQKLWRNQPKGFRYRIDLSAVRFPKGMYGRDGWKPLRFPMGQTDLWLASIVPAPDVDLGEASPVRRYRQWLSALVQAHGERKPKKRDEIITDAMANFPGLSFSEARRSWRDLTPDSWRKAGAPRKK